ncbi:Fic family protein [Pelagibacterium montanilacus]|uniref:Fic family protein n=1 Tax=Pelagibacterium montanilacus TaxID=2185280 RepID=UPI00319DD313
MGGDIPDRQNCQGGNWFCYPENIEAEMARLFGWAEGRDWFVGHPRERFVRELAHFIAELNAIHPFREGNGRTQFAVMSILTEVSGYGFNADALEPAVALDAMIQSFGGDNRNLERLVHALIA